jgi:hypothetical protein
MLSLLNRASRAPLLSNTLLTRVYRWEALREEARGTREVVVNVEACLSIILSR